MIDASSARGEILIVDDEEPAARLLARILDGHGYLCKTASDASGARRAMAEHEFPVVVTDLDMPGGSGLTLVRTLREQYPEVATLMVTGRGNPDVGRDAVEAGVYGYVTKPVIADELLVNVMSAFRRRELDAAGRMQRDRLETLVKDRTRALWDVSLDLGRVEDRVRVSREETIKRLAIAAEARDDETARHVERMSRYTALLAGHVFDDAQIAEEYRLASVLHDIGKLAIPESILLKPGKLTEDEFEVIKTHAEAGHRILQGSGDDLIQLAATVAWTHHERFDGGGYPRRLRGSDIPLAGRIAAIADVFDAISSNRVYRRAFDLPETLEIMRDGRGSHFDPELLDIFFDLLPEALSIREADPVGG